MHMFRTLAVSAIALAAALTASASHAAITGTIWEGNGITGDASFDQFLLQNVFGPVGPVASFNSTLIDYGTDSSQSFSQWLNNAGQNDGASLSPNIGGDQATNFFMTLHGTINLSAGSHNFGLLSDDGALLFVNGGTVVDDNGAHGPQGAAGVFNAPTSGAYTLDIIYSECCGGPAVLNATLDGGTIAGVPEPTTWALMIGGFAGAGAALRRAQRKPAAVTA